MAAMTIPCSGCSVSLELPDGKKKIRCPRCGTAVEAAQAQPTGTEPEEIVQLEAVSDPGPQEEVYECSAVSNNDEVEPDDQPRPRSKRRQRDTDGVPWLVAIAVAFGSYGCGALCMFAVMWSKWPHHRLVKFHLGTFFLQLLGGGLIAFVVALPTMYFSVGWIKARIAIYKGQAYYGTNAIVMGIVMALVGGLIGGGGLSICAIALESLIRKS